MFAEIMILAAFLLIVCAAAGIYSLLRITSAESMVLAIILLTGIMYGGVTVQQSRAAAILYALLAVLGLFLFICVRTGVKKRPFSHRLLRHWH